MSVSANQKFAPADDVQCDVLLFFATQTEEEQLRAVAGQMHIPFEKRTNEKIGSYYWIGVIGTTRVNAIKTRIGSFKHQGSASQGILCRIATTATSIIQVGMAFGLDRSVQKHGDVLVSEFIFPYDDRTIKHVLGGYEVDYERTEKYRAKSSLIDIFERESGAGGHPFGIHIGGLLSGGARIFSQDFVKELVSRIEAKGISGGEFVGGEMEGVGLLCIGERADPLWIVVKGISDFADDERNAEIVAARPTACRNAAICVLSALRRRHDENDGGK